MKSGTQRWVIPEITVSTLAVEWIEIPRSRIVNRGAAVSTLAVEWIEMVSSSTYCLEYSCLHPRGGVD